MQAPDIQKCFLGDTAAATLCIDEEQLPKLASMAGALPKTLCRILVRGSAALIQGKASGAEVLELSAVRAE